ncbi:MAG: hypothetical protein DMG40_11035 [Acidobacteria bacterium]|nr:MAG: hypothetical protein DMG40_11035 [Acidobacteriota bacterium]
MHLKPEILRYRRMWTRASDRLDFESMVASWTGLGRRDLKFCRRQRQGARPNLFWHEMVAIASIPVGKNL